MHATNETLSRAEKIAELKQLLLANPHAISSFLKATEAEQSPAKSETSVDFSIIFFSDAENYLTGNKYRLVMDVARYADQHGFRAVWVPERHFHPFGGIYSSPSTLAAALAVATRNIRLRAGSVVLPLQHPIRVAEAWSMVDNLSGGRVDLSFASGWNADDFVLAPENYPKLRELWLEGIPQFARLWRGDPISLPNGKGEPFEVTIYPRPIQKNIDIWLTATSKVESFEAAGRLGCNILTMLVSSTIDELGEKIASYREARAEHGFDPETGVVSLMMHAFVHPDNDHVRNVVRSPFLNYILSSVKAQAHFRGIDPHDTEEIERLADFSFERYYRHALFGNADDCCELIDRLAVVGVNEVACLVDFGADHREVVDSLSHLNTLRSRYRPFSPTYEVAEQALPEPIVGTTVPTRGNGSANPKASSAANIHSASGSHRESIVPRASGAHRANTNRTANQDVAIVGMSGRFPEAPDLRTYWENLAEGRECISEIPASRWDWRGFQGDPAAGVGRTRVRKAGFIEGVDRFDPLFFNISPREAAVMDPHHRVFMETAWSAIESSGHDPTTLAGSSMGIFVAIYNTDFAELQFRRRGDKLVESAFHVTGLVHSILPNRISHFLDVTGPSEVVDTACSSSLVAVHRACNALRDGECEAALVGGVSLILTPFRILALSKLGMLSGSGHTRAFDKNPCGQVMGEGAGALFLKPLQTALNDGDPILGVIKATAVGHNGRRSGSLTLPNANAQADVMLAAFEQAGFGPESLSYLEAHGAGGSGDFIELSAFREAFETYRRRHGSPEPDRGGCLVGSVKPNIGFLEAAGGMSQIIKVLLALNHKTIPATLNHDESDPELALDDSPFRIVVSSQPWQPRERKGVVFPRRAGIHAYGLGGVNAHVLVEEFPTAAAEPAIAGEELILLSATDRERLHAQAHQLLDHLKRQTKPPSIVDLAYTLAIGRKSMDWRLAIVADSIEVLCERLSQFLAGQTDVRGVFVSDGRRRTSATDHSERQNVSSMVAARRWEKLAALWVGGMPIDRQMLADRRRGRRIPLPTYPFAAEEFSLPRPASVNGNGAGSTSMHPLLDDDGPTFQSASFHKEFTGQEAYMCDHRMGGRPMLPGVAYLEMARAAGERLGGKPFERLSHVVWASPVLGGDESAKVIIDLEQESDDGFGFRIWSRGVAGEQTHSRGRLHRGRPAPASCDIDSLWAAHLERLDPESFYSELAGNGREYGESFRLNGPIAFGERSALAYLKADRTPDESGFLWPPSLLDRALHAVLAIGAYRRADTGRLQLPYFLNSCEILAAPASECLAYAELAGDINQVDRFRVRIMDIAGHDLFRFDELVMRRVGAAASAIPNVAVKEAPVEPRCKTTKRLDAPSKIVAMTELVADLLGLAPERLHPDTDLREYGCDSLLYADLTASINRRYQLELTPLMFIDHPTISQLAQALPEPSTTDADESARQEASADPASPALQRLREVIPGIDVTMVRTTAGDSIEVFSAGSGPPVLILSGIGATAEIWSAQLADWSSRYRLVIPHYPLYGRSTSASGAPSAEALAVAMLDVLSDLAITEPAHVLGWSFGGMVAIETALLAPQRIASLVLVSSAATLGKRPDEIDRATLESLAQVYRDDLGLFLAGCKSSARRLEVKRHLTALEEGSGRHPAAGYAYLRAAFDFNARTRLAKLSHPALVISGVLDAITSVDFARELADALPSGECWLLDKAGHFPFITHAGLFNRKVAAFLKRAQSGLARRET